MNTDTLNKMDKLNDPAKLAKLELLWRFIQRDLSAGERLDLWRLITNTHNWFENQALDAVYNIAELLDCKDASDRALVEPVFDRMVTKIVDYYVKAHAACVK